MMFRFHWALPTFAATSWYHKKLDSRYPNLNCIIAGSATICNRLTMPQH